MPSHQDRREPLPEGYQFGDAKFKNTGAGLNFSAYLEDRTRGADRTYRASVRERLCRSWNATAGENH